MKAPINWLKEYIDIKMNLKELMWKMTEAGLTTEAFEKIGDDIVLDIEVTPNRPDWLSMVGVANELAAIQNKKTRFPKIGSLPKKIGNLPIKIKTDLRLSGRYTGITMQNVTVKDSPKWLKERLILIGLRPINNLVDITNYVMLELGIPIHVFDYDKFLGKQLIMKLAAGGESFTSVDGKSYKLPKNAIVISDDSKRIIDLCGIKGGKNTEISKETKNIYIHLPIYQPSLIRKTSQKLDLRSDASYIYERGANAGGTIDSLKRVVGLIKELAGGEVASELIDIKDKSYSPSKLELNLDKLTKVLGVDLPAKNIVDILTSLNLAPVRKNNTLVCTIPTYRGDLKIEADLIEEIARIYGYNNFPRTLPYAHLTVRKVPYYFDDKFHLYIKRLLAAYGFSEVMTLSLVSEEMIVKSNLEISKHLNILNPVSIDYKYLRTSLIPSLLMAVRMNEEKVNLFELQKTYLGKPGKTIESYRLTLISNAKNFRDFKGIVDSLLTRLNIRNTIVNMDNQPTNGLWNVNSSGILKSNKETLGVFGQINESVINNFQIKDRHLFACDLDLNVLENLSKEKMFSPIMKYPSQIEDLTLVIPEKTKIGDMIIEIQKQENVEKVELRDIYENAYTFRIWYQSDKKTLENKEVEKIREKIIAVVNKKFGATVK